MPPSDASVWRQRSVAGGSATAAFDRRTARHQERVRSNRPRILLAGLAIIVVGLWLTTVDRWVIAGWGLVAVGVLSTLGRLFLAPNHVRAWSIGATGEVHVGALLDGLEARGWFVLHDRRVPGARENIDHLLIGPPGVVVVETKNYAGQLRVRGGELTIGGRRKTGFLDQVERQIDAVERALEIDHAAGVICVLRADFPWFSRTVARGIVIVPGRRLIATVTSPPPRLSSAEVERLARVAEERLVPAVRQQADPTT